MNPDELWIGKVLFVGIMGLAIGAITALLHAKSEGARRARIVIVWSIGLALAWAVFMAAGPVGFLVTLAVIGAAAWIAKGIKK